MVSIWVAVVVLVLLYFIMDMIFKVSKVVIVVVILLLLLGFLFFGYRDVSEIKDLPQDTSEVLDGIKDDNVSEELVEEEEETTLTLNTTNDSIELT